MPTRRMGALLAAILASALLAGCSDAPTAAPEATPEPCLVTSAEDNACMQRDLNRTGAAAPHLHDYWGGKKRLTLTDVEVSASPFLCTEVATVALLRPADGQSIIQGTAQVEATLAWEAQAPTDLPATTELWVKTAADSAPALVGPLTSGGMVVLPTDDARNDLPHQRLSAWEFHFAMRPANELGCFTYDGAVRLHLELVRGPDPIPLYPGHPDRWGGQQEMPLLQHDRTVFYYTGGTAGTCLGGPDGGECLWTPHAPDNGTVVPSDAAQVVVTVAATDASPLRVKLAYHGADSRELTLPAPDEDDGTTRTYRLAVGAAGDGPYARQSQWEFRLLPDNPAETYDGSYTIKAVARRTAA